jgi:hypothetical protein
VLLIIIEIANGWLTAGTLLTLNPWTFEAAFLPGIGGAGMALLTPLVGGLL